MVGTFRREVSDGRNYRLGLYEKAMPAQLDWPRKLREAKAAGYDFVEISIDETEEKLERLDMSGKQRLDLIKQMYEAGIHIETMCLSGHRKYPLGSADPMVRKRGIQILDKAVLFARDLGIRIIQLAGYDVYYESATAETWQLFSEGLRHGVGMAEKYGVLLAFETMETPFLDTVEKALRWVERDRSPYLAIYPDSGNLTNAAVLYNRDALSDLEKGKGFLAALHLKESAEGRYREVPFGTGHVDFQRIIAGAYRLGVRRYVAEFWDTGKRDWQEGLCAVNIFLREKFEEAGL